MGSTLDASTSRETTRKRCTHTEEKFKNDSAQTLRHVGERCLEKTGKVLVAFDGDGYIIVNLEYKNSLFQAWLPNDGVEGGGVVCCSPWHQLQLLQPLQNRKERRKSATSGDAAAGGLKFPEAQLRTQPRLCIGGASRGLQQRL